MVDVRRWTTVKNKYSKKPFSTYKQAEKPQHEQRQCYLPRGGVTGGGEHEAPGDAKMSACTVCGVDESGSDGGPTCPTCVGFCCTKSELFEAYQLIREPLRGLDRLLLTVHELWERFNALNHRTVAKWDGEGVDQVQGPVVGCAGGCMIVHL